jgi:hypothetical protein
VAGDRTGEARCNARASRVAISRTIARRSAADAGPQAVRDGVDARGSGCGSIDRSGIDSCRIDRCGTGADRSQAHSTGGADTRNAHACSPDTCSTIADGADAWTHSVHAYARAAQPDPVQANARAPGARAYSVQSDTNSVRADAWAAGAADPVQADTWATRATDSVQSDTRAAGTAHAVHTHARAADAIARRCVRGQGNRQQAESGNGCDG